MKPLKNKKNSLKQTMSYLLFFTILILSSCNKDDTQPNCGCDSETLVGTIPNYNIQVPIEEQKSGFLFFKHPEIPDYFYNTEQYDNHFWITQGIETHFIICDENLLGTEYDYLKNTNDSIPISFTGDLNFLCTGPFFAPTVYFCAEIKLNSIEQQ